MIGTLYERLFRSEISLKRRAIQATNFVAMPVLGRQLGLIHLVEYPKCGGSWVRNMLQSYLGSPHVDLTRRLLARDGVIQTHELHKPHLRPAVVVVRDPRDAYTSFYHYENNFEHRAQQSPTARWFTHDPQAPLQDDFLGFLRAKLLHPSHPWFFYSEFIASWQHRPGVHVVRYEDFLSDPQATLTQLLRALGRPIDLDRVAQAVADNTFEAVTRRQYGETRQAGEADNKRFVRKGVAGDWKNHFNREAAELLQQVDGGILRSLGYEADGAWIDAHFGAAEG